MLPKPRPCHQQWLAMSPTQGGRLCGQCEKVIIDFSKMSWAEIVALQHAHGNTLCGMYSPRQLKYWGREVPTLSTLWKKTMVGVGATLSLSVAIAQSDTTALDSLYISGNIIEEPNKAPLQFATVRLTNNPIATFTDSLGSFRLVLAKKDLQVLQDTLTVEYVGFPKHEFPISNLLEDTPSQFTVSEQPLTIIRGNRITYTEALTSYFYAQPPTLKNRIKWKWKQFWKRFRGYF